MQDLRRDCPTPAAASDLRSILYQQLHLTYEPQRFDSWRVWAGNLSVDIDGYRFGSLARAYVGPDRPPATARVEVELFVAAADPTQVRSGDVAVRLWTGARDAGQPASGAGGQFVAMELLVGSAGLPLLTENGNLRFRSAPLQLKQTGAFACVVQFSADPLPQESGQKRWLSVGEIAENRDPVIVVSPAWVADCPAVLEVCVRKTGASRGPDGHFRSGRFTAVTEQLERLPGRVLYLLPFFKPGFYDLHTGSDVRKGSLGSPYAVADFFALDGELATPPEQADLASLVADDLLHPADVEELWSRVPCTPGADGDVGHGPDSVREVPSLQELTSSGALPSAARWGRERLVQLVGRGELRALTRRAHQLGKRVIFDLVLMQTSRDNALVGEHPEWYVRGEDGRPSIHRIAWLEYSDVALFDLPANAALQDYLLEIAPYWIERCDLDGVRIDASQTVDRPFLMRVKNRINAAREEALVLGETLCPIEEAVDVPVDMVYALMVDHHRDSERASPIIDLLEEMNVRFAAGTVALAYFENHDSPRATQIWHERFAAALSQADAVHQYWCGLARQLAVTAGPASRSPRELAAPSPEVELDDAAVLMSLLKNLQASIINATAGSCAAAPVDAPGPDRRPVGTSTGTNLAYGVEMGSDWGERTRTDFESESLLDETLREREPNARLVRAYAELARRISEWPEIRRGRVYFHRHAASGGEESDRILAYTRYDTGGAVLALNNLDCREAHTITCSFPQLSRQVNSSLPLFDSYEALGLATGAAAPAETGADGPVEGGLRLSLAPLQTQVLRLS